MDECVASLEELLKELSNNHSRNPEQIESIIDSVSIPLPPLNEDVMSMFFILCC